MKRNLRIAMLMLAVAAASAGAVYLWMRAPSAGGAWAGDAPDIAPGDGRATEALYQCPMHPGYVSDSPGDCGICGMRLLPTEASVELPTSDKPMYRSTMIPGEVSEHPGKDSMGMDMVPVEMAAPTTGAEVAGHAVVNIPAHKQQYIGVRSEPVARRRLASRIEAVARVDYDETGLSWVNAKVAGWIEALHVDRTGQSVVRGQPLLDIYSPELVATQEEYLLARDNLARLEQAGALPSAVSQARSLVQDAGRRLRLWDIPEAAIKALDERGSVVRRLTLPAPVSGYVVEKAALAGQAVRVGENLFRIADLSRVWVLAQVYESQVAQLREGQQADIHISYLPGRSFTGTVDFIYPYLDPKTRTVQVRLVLANPDLSLRPEMYASVSFHAPEAEPVLAVPNEAILDTGERRIAFVLMGEGTFEPRELTTGLRTRDYTEIRAGLAEGEMIVTSGNFLIDSESRLKAALASMGQGRRVEHSHDEGAEP